MRRSLRPPPLGAVAAAVLLLITCTGLARTITVVSYNVQNLFDATDDGGEYREFTRAGGWTSDLYTTKLRAIGSALHAAERGGAPIWSRCRRWSTTARRGGWWIWSWTASATGTWCGCPILTTQPGRCCFPSCRCGGLGLCGSIAAAPRPSAGPAATWPRALVPRAGPQNARQLPARRRGPNSRALCYRQRPLNPRR